MNFRTPLRFIPKTLNFEQHPCGSKTTPQRSPSEEELILKDIYQDLNDLKGLCQPFQLIFSSRKGPQNPEETKRKMTSLLKTLKKSYVEVLAYSKNPLTFLSKTDGSQVAYGRITLYFQYKFPFDPKIDYQRAYDPFKPLVALLSHDLGQHSLLVAQELWFRSVKNLEEDLGPNQITSRVLNSRHAPSSHPGDKPLFAYIRGILQGNNRQVLGWFFGEEIIKDKYPRELLRVLIKNIREYSQNPDWVIYYYANSLEKCGKPFSWEEKSELMLPINLEHARQLAGRIYRTREPPLWS